MYSIDVLIVGSLNIDHVLRVERLPEAGETLRCDSYKINFGGKGANQAVAAARCGVITAFIGCIGNDAYGQAMVARLHEEKIDCSSIARAGGSTGSAFIFVDSRGQNVIGIYPGANNLLSEEHIQSLSKVIKSGRVILLQHEIPAAINRMVSETAKENNSIVILNPAPARTVGQRQFSNIACIIPNKMEAQILSGITISTDDDIRSAARYFHRNKIQDVIITLGERGVFVSSGGHNAFIDAKKVQAVDTVAAGDCFCGVFAASVAAGNDRFASAEIACAAASISVTRHGAMDSMPTISEMNTLLCQRKEGIC
jgi:ribokinase